MDVAKVLDHLWDALKDIWGRIWKSDQPLEATTEAMRWAQDSLLFVAVSWQDVLKRAPGIVQLVENATATLRVTPIDKGDRALACAIYDSVRPIIMLSGVPPGIRTR